MMGQFSVRWKWHPQEFKLNISVIYEFIELYQ